MYQFHLAATFIALKYAVICDILHVYSGWKILSWVDLGEIFLRCLLHRKCIVVLSGRTCFNSGQRVILLNFFISTPGLEFFLLGAMILVCLLIDLKLRNVYSLDSLLRI